MVLESADQRKRLLEACSEVIAAGGYQESTVEQIVCRAKVSRSTFYELFTDKRDCFLATHARLAKRLAVEVEGAAANAPQDKRWREAVGAIVRFADREPAAFYLLSHEAMLAGAPGWHARGELLARLERALASPMLDMPPGLVAGGVMRMLGLHLRRDERRASELLAGLLEWLASYVTVDEPPRWTWLRSCAVLTDTDTQPSPPLVPLQLPRGRHRWPAELVRRVQRERLLHATAEVVSAKGDVNVSVAEIVLAAGLSREVFYANFGDKQQALLGAQVLTFEALVGSSASTFYTPSPSWADRVWDTGRVFSRFLASASHLSNLMFVETYATGSTAASTAASRADHAIAAFMVLLDQGSQQHPQSESISPLASEAIVMAILELIAGYLIEGRAEELPGLLPIAAYTSLTPFIGREVANELVERKLREAERSAKVERNVEAI